MKRAPLLVAALFAALACAAPASAQDPPPPPPVIAAGVTVSGVPVEGLTAEEATAALHAFFDRRIPLAMGPVRMSVAPAEVGGRARVFAAVQAALAAPENATLTLGVAIRERRLARWVKRRAKAFHRAPVSTRVRLVDLRPRLRKAKQGRGLVQWRARRRLAAALRTHNRAVVSFAVRWKRPALTPRRFGPVVVIRRESKTLRLYRPNGAGPMRRVATFGVATGMAAYPTALGKFEIVTKQRNPWWYPPKASWASGAKPIPPGPGNPLGTRWMGLSVGAVGIHGTPDAASIGYSASHGCIRMHISSAEWLFERVRIGTPVFIVRA